MRRLLLVLLLGFTAFGCRREAEHASSPSPASPPRPAPDSAPAAHVDEAQARTLTLEATRAAERAALDAHRAMGQSPSSSDMAASEARLARVQQRMMQAITEAVEAVPTEELQAALPKALPGFARTSLSGQTSGKAGAAVSVGIATFEAEGKRIHLEVTDAGAMKAFTAMAATGWRGVDIDRKTTHGYERTSEISGHRAFESFENQGPRAIVRVLVAGRFLLEVEGVGVSMEAVQAAVKAVDLAGLAKKKDFGRTAVEPAK